jgi:hypothetical protein
LVRARLAFHLPKHTSDCRSPTVGNVHYRHGTQS